jgi:hypothetical protein
VLDHAIEEIACFNSTVDTIKLLMWGFETTLVWLFQFHNGYNQTCLFFHDNETAISFNSTMDTIKRQRKEEEERRRKGFNSTMDTIKPLRKHQSYQAL